MEVPKQQDWKPKPDNGENSFLFSGSAAKENRKVRTDADRMQRERRESIRQRMSARRAAEELMSELQEIWDD